MSKRLSETDILIRVKDGDLGLTDPVLRAAWDRPIAYQSDLVRKWLASELPLYPEMDSEALVQLDPDEGTWFVFRGNDLYGPVSSRFLTSYSADGEIFCFSLSYKCRADLKTFHSLPWKVQETSKLYFQRASVRRPARHLVQLRNQATSASAVIEDFSTGGVGLQTRMYLVVGEALQVNWDHLGVKPQVEVEVRRKVGSHYGLRFLELDQIQMKALAALVKTE